MRVPFVDLARGYRALKAEIDAAIAGVVEEQRFILGPRVEELERRIAERVDAAHAVGCASGTDALLLALVALGVGSGDEVVTTPFSFFATAGTIARTGARAVFADIDAGSFNLDPACVERVLTPRTKAIVPVHLYGRVAAMGPILEVAGRRGLAVVEDAAQALGSWDGDLERPAGNLGATVACLSFFPTKNLGGYGDGGMLVTDDAALAARVRKLRVHGGEPGVYYHEEVGMNSRLDAIQAAVLLAKIPHLDRWNLARRANAAAYERALAGLPLGLPGVPCGHSFHQYTVRVPDGRRDAFRDHLRARGVETAVYYPLPLHLQPCFRSLGYREGDLPAAERAALEVVSLPVFPELTVEERDAVAAAARSFYPG